MFIYFDSINYTFKFGITFISCCCCFPKYRIIYISLPCKWPYNCLIAVGRYCTQSSHIYDALPQLDDHSMCSQSLHKDILETRLKRRGDKFVFVALQACPQYQTTRCVFKSHWQKALLSKHFRNLLPLSGRWAHFSPSSGVIIAVIFCPNCPPFWAEARVASIRHGFGDVLAHSEVPLLYFSVINVN